MMISLLPVLTYFLLSFSSVVYARTVLPRDVSDVSVNASSETWPSLLKERDGYRAVAYYVNWVCFVFSQKSAL